MPRGATALKQPRIIINSSLQVCLDISQPTAPTWRFISYVLSKDQKSIFLQFLQSDCWYGMQIASIKALHKQLKVCKIKKDY